MHVLSTSPAEPQSAGHRRPAPPAGCASAQRLLVAVDTVGYLVPCMDFAGGVQTVFARACNIACDGTLLTLTTAGVGNGPATLALAVDAAEDLRRLFDAGERIDCHRGRARTARVELRLAGARVWRPAAPRPLLPGERIDANVRFARERLGERRRTHSSVIDREAAPIVSALTVACRNLDRERAVRQIDRLIGWGEGLTPAGDDLVVGLCAGLVALVGRDGLRRRFLDAIGVAAIARGARTTPIAAHQLRLAAGGHYGESLLRARDALLGEPRRECVESALDRALAVGATSGADAVTGLLCGLAAWLAPTPEPA
jgi:hypothetical protein